MERKMEDATNESADNEIQAMSKLATILAPLNGEAKKRVLSWAYEFFSIGGISTKKVPRIDDESNDNGTPRTLPNSGVAEIFDAADPKTGAEKALIVAYWLQVHQGQDGFSSQSVNKELKNLGHGVANITAAFTDLLEQKLALQIQKSGKSQQARKVYKLTRKGTLQVEAMINIGEQQ
jgi:hypothetical protein